MKKDDLKEMFIYTAITNLEKYIDDCKTVGFGGAAKRVELEDINALISDIKIHIPEEMSRAQAIISEAENIIDSAQMRADEITEQANISASGIRERAKRHADEMKREAELERDRLLDEHEITIQAKLDADHMIEATQKACQDTYEHAQIETSELLDEAERCLHNCVKAVHSERDRLGVRKMQTRYEAVEEPEQEALYDDEYEQESEPVVEENINYGREETVEPRRAREAVREQEPAQKAKKRSPIKIGDLARRYLNYDDGEENTFSDDDDSFDSDEDVDD